MPTIYGTTQLFGIIGDPVTHSLSPVMQNAAIAHLGIDAVYVPFPVRGSELAIALLGLAATGVRGFNVTIPHKQDLMPLLAEMTPIAQQIGAVNTVWRTTAGWAGTNTDVAGFLAPLQGRRDWSTVRPVVLGNGGAARAVVAGCAELGCPEIVVVGRNAEKLSAFAQSWSEPTIASRLTVKTWETLATLILDTQLLINTTPIGMHPHELDSPVAAELLAKLPAGAIAYDLIYTPRPTQFLRLAARSGAQTIDGTEMLVQQGAAALHLWVQQPAPVDVMRSALLQAL
jgi:shikimate dehydrogenase